MTDHYANCTIGGLLLLSRTRFGLFIEGIGDVRNGFLAVIVLLAIPASSVAQDHELTAIEPVLDDQALLHKYVWSTLGLPGALHATFASAFEQWRGAPPEWGTGAGGYPKRWASQFAAAAIGSTTKYAVARALHQDPSFARCRCSGVGPRLRHALISPFAARTRDGRQVFSPATVASIAAENIIPASTWYPEPHGTRDGLAHAGSGIVAKIGVDIFREFVTIHKLPRTP
jgi:hypothetical protein